MPQQIVICWLIALITFAVVAFFAVVVARIAIIIVAWPRALVLEYLDWCHNDYEFNYAIARRFVLQLFSFATKIHIGNVVEMRLTAMTTFRNWTERVFKSRKENDKSNRPNQVKSTWNENKIDLCEEKWKFVCVYWFGHVCLRWFRARKLSRGRAHDPLKAIFLQTVGQLFDVCFIFILIFLSLTSNLWADK